MDDEIDVTKWIEPTIAKELMLQAIVLGTAMPIPHCKAQMAERNIRLGDIINCVKRGEIVDSYPESGEWRYVIRDDVTTVIVSFPELNAVDFVSAF